MLRKLADASKLSDGQRTFLARRLNQLRYTDGVDLLSAKVLTDPSGKHVPLAALREVRRFVHVKDATPLACSAHGEAGIFVVTDKLLERFNVSSLGDWLRTMERLSLLDGNYETIDADRIAELCVGSGSPLQVDGLTLRERAAFAALQLLNERLAANMAAAGLVNQARELLVGTHRSRKGRTNPGGFVAWTDGKTYITANRRYLRLFDRGRDGVLEWLQTLVHEYTHDTDDSESHSHGEVFYRKFHDTILSGSCLCMASLAQLGLMEYLAQLSKAGAARPRKLSRQLKPTKGLRASAAQG